MSRIGKKPVELPKGVTATLSGQTIEVKGPKGTRSFTATDDVTLSVDEGAVSVKPRGLSKRARQQWGMSRTQVANLVSGVTTGFKKEMEITGVGYKAELRGSEIHFALGYSHPVVFKVPEGIKIEIDKANKIMVKQAIEALFGVSVQAVNMLIVKPKKKRILRSRNQREFGRKGGYKKAIVTLAAGDSIDIFGDI